MRLKNFSFKMLSLILTVAMLLSVCATTISAVEEMIPQQEEEKTTINYVSIGDSMTNGYGFVGYAQDDDTGYYDFIAGENMYGAGSYALQFEEYLSEGGKVDVNHTKLAPSALLSDDLLYLLGGRDEEFNDYWGGYRDYVGKKYKNEDAQLKAHFQDAVRNADVITLGIGNASFGAFLVDRVTNAIGIMGGTPASYPNLTLENGLALLEDEEAKQAVMAIYEDFKADFIASAGESFVDMDLDAILDIVGYTVASFLLSYDAVIDEIARLNPDAEVILIGLMNTTYGLEITGKDIETIAIGDVMDEMFDLLNAYIAGIPALKQYSGECEEMTFYYAAQPTPKFICQVYDDLATAGWGRIDCGKADCPDCAAGNACENGRLEGQTVRSRNIDAYNGMLRGVIGSALGFELPAVTMADVENYVFDEEGDQYQVTIKYAKEAAEFGAYMNGAGMSAVAEKMGSGISFGDAVVAVAKDAKFELVAKLLTAHKGELVLNSDYSNNVEGVLSNPGYVGEVFASEIEKEISIAIYLAIEEAVVANVDATEITVEGLYGIATNIFEALGDMPEELKKSPGPVTIRTALVNWFVNSENGPSMCKIYGLFKVGNGMSVHPTPAGHDELFEVIKTAYEEKYTAHEETINNLQAFRAELKEDNEPSEILALISQIYMLLESTGSLADYEKELALIDDLYIALNDDVTDEEFVAIFDYIFGALLEGGVNEEELAAFVYATLITNKDEATARSIAEKVYNVLKTNGFFADYTEELAVLEKLYAAIDEYVSDAQAVDILDYLYATLLSGEVNKAALTNYLYTELIKNNDAETAMAIVEEVYAVLKASGYLKGLEDELKLVEKLYAALGDYVSDAEFAAILDFVYNELNEGGIDEIELVQYLYETLIASNEASTAVAIIGEVYSVLKAEGYLTAYANELKVVEELCVALDPFVSDEQVMQIVSKVYLAIIDGEVTNAEVRDLAKFIYFDVLAITEIAPEPRTLAVKALPGLAAITPATKIEIIETVYTILKDNNYIDSTPEMQAIEDLYYDLSDAELLTDEQILAIFDTVVETFVENEVIGEEEIADVAEQIVEDILLNEDIPTEDKITIIEKVSGALADSNIDAGVEIPTIPALPVIKDIQLALKAAGYLTDAQANDLLNYVYAMLTSGEEITEDKLAAFAEYVYNEIFNREGLTVADRAEIVRIVYTVLEDHGYISQQIIVDALIEAVETLKTLIPEYYDDAYAYGYAYALENGYVAAAVAALDAAIASVKSVDLDGYAMTDVSKANIVNELNAVVATLEEIKAAIENGNVADVNALVNTVLALEDDLYAHLENLKVFGIQAGINVYSMVIVPQIEIITNEVIPAVMLTVDNILQKAHAQIVAKIAEVYGIIIDVNATVEEIYARIAAKLAELYGIVVDANATAEEIYAAIRDHVAHVMAGELTLSEDTFYLAIVDGDEAYADLVVDALNLSADQYKMVAMSEVTAEDIARASFITVAYNGSSALDFALAQGVGFASEYIDGEFRADLNAYLANAFKDILTEQGMDNVSTALNGALDTAISDLLGNATVTELDWVALVGEENLAYVNELRAVIAAVLTEAGLPDTYSETVDVVALLWDNAEELGLSDLIANFKQSYFYEQLGDNAYYTIDVPVRDIVDVAVDAALYEFISYNKDYSKTMLAINALNPDATVAVLGNYNRFDLEETFDLVFPEITFTVAEALEALGFDGSAINAEILKVLDELEAIEDIEINIFVAELVDIALGEYNNAVNYVLSIELPVCDQAELLISALVDACNAYVYGFAGEISKTDVYTITIPMSDYVALAVAQAPVVNDMIEAALATEIVIPGGTVTVEANDVLDSIANLTSIHPFVYAALYRNVYYVDISDAKVGGAEYIAAQILKALSITCEHAFDNACDADCNFECGYTREVADHVYDHDCDVDCNECGATRDELVHHDDNKDHICDNCDTVLSECADADKDHKCDYCGATLSECADADKDHKCDYCGETLSECADADKDHNCDYCGAELGECADTDKDHKCDYCGAVLSECADADKDHKCDYCGETLSECADADKDHNCDYCGETISECADADKDHKCDYCGETLGECADADKDHKCDVCGAVLSECEEKDNDHKCDVCGEKISECLDLDMDHHCDICGATMSECADADKDHKCDYCGAELGECADTDKDHKCDYCGAVLSECADADKDHKCDYCGETLSECADDDKDHNCDYCGAELSKCDDANKDHKCDLCGAVLSECADANKDHKCDYCGAVLSECADADKDHKCDLCGATLSECADANKDHKCDLCGATLSECADADKNHKCDICGATLSECADADKDHKCDYCGAVLSKCDDADKDHKCDLCGAVLSECADVVKNHKCDYCGATLSECADENNDHKCEYCGNTVSEHKWADATCKAPKTCEICGKTEGKVADHKYGDWETVKEATTKEEGEQKKTCKVCGDTVTEAIPMLEKSSPAGPIIAAVVIVVVAGLGTAFVVLKKKKIF